MITKLCRRTWNTENNYTDVIIQLENKNAFLLSNEYSYILSWDYRDYLLSTEQEIELYELSFDEELKNFIISKIIKGILQFRILSLPSFFISFKDQKNYMEKYKIIKNIYKELKEMNITKELTFKEKLIILLLT